MRVFYFSLVLSSLIFCGRSQGQSCSVVEYTAENGLPGITYTGLVQDDEGFLWVSTYNSGIARFDGKNWQVFKASPGGLLSNDGHGMRKAPDGSLWIWHSGQGITRYKDGKFQQFKHAEIAKNKAWMLGGMDSRNSLLYYCDNKARKIRSFNPITGQFLPGDIKLPGDSTLECQGVHRGSGLAANDMVFQFQNKKKQAREIWHYSNGKWHWMSENLPVIGKDETFGATAFLHYQTLLTAQNIWYYQNDRWKILHPPPILLLDKSKASVSPVPLYCNADNGGEKLFVLWKIEDRKPASRYLLAEYDAEMRLLSSLVFASRHTPKIVLKDKAGTFWVGCETALLRIFPQFFNVSVDDPNALVNTWGVAQAPDGNIWFASYGQGMARFDGLNVHPQPAFLQPFTHYDDGSLVDRHTGDMYFNIENLVDGQRGSLLRFDGKNRWALFNKGTWGIYLAYDKKGQLLRGSLRKKGLWMLPNGADIADTSAWKKIDKSKGLDLESVATALEDKHGRYWMGRHGEGLACYDPRRDTVWNWVKRTRPENYGVMSMAEDPRGNLWLGTDMGLCFLEMRESFNDSFDMYAHLRRIGAEYTGDDLMTVCRLYDERTLILGNAKGFYLLDLEAFYKEKAVRIRSFVRPTGHLVGSINQNGIWIDRDKNIWLTGSQGVTCFRPQLFNSDTLPPVVRLDSMVAGGEIFHDFSGNIIVGSSPGWMRIWLGHKVETSLLNNVRFRYRLDGDSIWSVLSNGNMIELSDFTLGKHTLRIIAEREGYQSVPTSIQFFILPFWLRNPSFWLAIVGVLALAGALLRRNEQKIHQQQLQIEKSKTEMEAMSKEKDKLQVQAIVNQLNPHFINNALQWLQVRLDDDQEAVGVVGKLSENISTVFKNSRNKKAFHPLRDELKLAENYLFIQKCRFRDKLHYEMPDEASVQKVEAVDVPLMMVQIHVENAVEHGIRNKPTGRGSVRITLREDDDYVVFTIEDDGVGRATAKKIGSQGTQQGTKMLQELEVIYNRQNRLPIEQTYEDNICVDDEGKLHGTRVVVRVPKNYNYEI